MIYFIQECRRGGFIKIGYTSREPFKRVNDLQTGNPSQLSVLGKIAGNIKLERVIHRELEQYQAMGEWFYPFAEVKKIVRQYIPDASFLDEAFEELDNNMLTENVCVFARKTITLDEFAASLIAITTSTFLLSLVAIIWLENGSQLNKIYFVFIFAAACLIALGVFSLYTQITCQSEIVDGDFVEVS